MYPLFLLVQGVKGLPLLQNITIPLPSGTSNHGSPGLLCTPTTWPDVIVFYLSNYAAHAITTRSLPGEKRSSVALNVLTALFFPAAGALRGILGINSQAIFGGNDLEKAARAGALCMVIRTPEWKPQDRDKLHNTILRLPLLDSNSKTHITDKRMLAGQVAASLHEEDHIGTNTTEPTQKTTRLAMYDPPWKHSFEDDLSESGFRIHGSYNIPAGYTLSRVPRQATFIEADTRLQTTQTTRTSYYNSLVKIIVSLGQPLHSIFTPDPATLVKSETSPQITQTTRLSYNYNLIKILVSLGQAIYAIFTLYRARGDQISQFGYAAFGLTVAPYAVVSVLNLFGSILCPEFPSIYMVESTIMEEARQRGDEYIFKGTVGKLAEMMILNATPPDAEEESRWILEPVIVSADASGELQVSSKTQVELSHILIGSTKTPETTMEDGSSPDENITTNTRNPFDERIESKRIEKPPRPNEEKTCGRLLVDLLTTLVMGRRTQISKAPDYPSEKLLLVPLVNQIKGDWSSRQISDYRIYSAVPGSTVESAWKVLTNVKQGLDLLTSVYLIYSASLVATMVPVAINGALSRFHKGHSTHAQRIWTMTWLGFGSLGSFFQTINIFKVTERPIRGYLGLRDKFSIRLAVISYAAPAIGGFVVVGQMVKSYGTCVAIS
ncbi:hypothetical protein BJ875DRAFT_544395 [Amylocarpus encephaloides]|uniref:Uncharacterized protein n=1 Tax=Amylocarpus encephaloides TaxID=45428 RepID=A0A9P7YGI2_9HELO|nr:hypothetical protein BJ875DRAFT_544395 [Amylocarpus encephaloides]